MKSEGVINNIGVYYNNLVRQFGHDPRSCDYGHANSQKIKFNVLSQVITDEAKTLLDVGCGFADYYDFLIQRHKNLNYHGVDISEMMILEAKKLHPGLNLELRNVFADPPQMKYDIVTANGIFYLLGKDSMALMSSFIEKMFNMSNQIVIFNSLSTWATDQVDGEFYADPLKTLAFCKSITPWVTLRHDYHPRDFTVYMYKNRNA